MKKILFSACVVFFAFLFLWHNEWSSSARDEKSAEMEVPGKNDIDQKVMSFSVDGRSPIGVRQWHIEATSAEITGEEEIVLNMLKAVAYADETAVFLTSNTGVYHKDAGEVELIGNVEVVSEEGFKLKTERAKWSHKDKKISTDEIVEITREGLVAVGKGGMADSENKRAVLFSDVSVTMVPETKVRCNGSLEVSYTDNKAIFRDNVVVEDKDGSLSSDKLTVDFDPVTQKLARVTAEGNVKIKRGNSYTLSEKAVYTDSTRSAKLEGNPRIIIDPTELAELNEMNVSGT